jgi:hypothetical protein
MSETASYETVTTPDDFVVSSTADTAAVMAESFAPPAIEETASEAETLAGGDTPETPAEDESKAETDARLARDEAGRFAKKRNDPIARMKDATAKEAAAKRERDEARAELAALKAERDAARQPPQERQAERPASQGDPEPDPNDTSKYPDGQFDRKFYKDQARWEARQELREYQQQESRRQREQSMAQTWSQKLAEVQAETPDFATRWKPETPIDTRMVPYLKSHEMGPRIALALSDDQTNAQRIATLPLERQFEEFGKMIARFEAASSRGTASTPSPSRATAPITPLGGGHMTTVDAPSDDEPFEAHFKRENAKERSHRR